jgi:hypothetical protein
MALPNANSDFHFALDSSVEISPYPRSASDGSHCYETAFYDEPHFLGYNFHPFVMVLPSGVAWMILGEKWKYFTYYSPDSASIPVSTLQ